MTAPYVVQAQGMYPVPQRNSKTHDGLPDENALDDCWAALVCEFLRGYGVTRRDGSDYVPDDIKDWAFGQGTTNQIGYNTTIMNCLAHFGNIPSITVIPQGKQNGVSGLLDIEWQYLKRGIPLAESVYWIDDAGVVHKDVPHWTVASWQSEARVVSLDSWPFPDGGTRDEDYATHYARSKQIIVVPTIVPPKAA